MCGLAIKRDSKGVVIPVCIDGTLSYDATLPTSYIFAQPAQSNKSLSPFPILRQNLLLNRLEPLTRSAPFREVRDAKVCAQYKFHHVAKGLSLRSRSSENQKQAKVSPSISP